MRDGRFVAREPTASLTRRQMANLMVGRELADLYPPKDPAPDASVPPLLAVEGLDVPGWAEDIGFEVRPGEILGFAGLVGAGRTELFEGLLGLRPHTVARLELQGRRARLRSPMFAARSIPRPPSCTISPSCSGRPDSRRGLLISAPGLAARVSTCPPARWRRRIRKAWRPCSAGTIAAAPLVP